MDVRCEKCQTEYELDEARLKPGGVTVKCTTCGHMFKIRKRSPTQSGVPAVPAGRSQAASSPPPRQSTTPAPRQPPTPAPAPRPTIQGRAASASSPGAKTAVPEMRAQTGSGPTGLSGATLGGSTGDGERNWIIRMENGETRTCRELNTLQQWIIAGLVSRESMISRSGKTWKRLGDIGELASFFVVAEEARQSRSTRESGSITPPRLPAVEGRPTLAGVVAQPERETVVEPMRAPARPPAPPRPQTAPGPQAPAVLALPPLAPPPPVPQGSAPPPRSPLATAPTLMASMPAPAPAYPPPPRAAPPPPPMAQAEPPPQNQRSTGAWASDEIAPMMGEPAGPMGGAVRPAGPGSTGSFGGETFGGVVRPVTTDDVQFAAGGRSGLRAGEGDADNFDPFADPMRRKSGAGLWIALGSIVVIGAAAAIVYFMFLRGPAKQAGTGEPAAASDGGAGSALASTPDGGAAGDATAVAADDPLEAARTQLRGDSAPALVAAEKALADGGKADAVTLGMRARLLAAQAQIIEDEASLAADAATAEKIRRDEKKLVLAALALAQRAVKAAGADAAAAVLGNVAMADVMRLQGKPAKDVARYLDAARQAKPSADDQRELDLVAAQVAMRDKDARAATLVQALDSGDGALETSGDVRARWLAARLAMAAKKVEVVRAASEAILGLQPEHAGAKLLLAKVSGVDGTDPMPPEQGPDAGTGTGSGPGTGSGSGSGPGTGSGSGPGTGAVVVPSGESYDRLVAKADKLAEVDCGQAIQYYMKALDDRPAGVEALIGMGYCHIDAKQFSSAQSKFRTALALSPRNRDALRGVAEAYQQQGRGDLAIEAYKRYLEIYPDDERVKRQIERLGGGAGSGSGPATGPETNPGSGSDSDKPPAGSGSDKPPGDPAPGSGSAPAGDPPATPPTTP